MRSHLQSALCLCLLQRTDLLFAQQIRDLFNWPTRAREMATASPVALFDHFPVPTLDRPFGVHLWPIFSKAFEAVVGYPAEEFRFQAGVTPMSTIKETSIFIVIYYAVIFGGRELMRNREPFKLRTLFLIHNFYLTAISGILLALFIEQLLGTVVRKGIFFAICDRDGGWTQPLVVLYYVGSPRDLPVPLHQADPPLS